MKCIAWIGGVRSWGRKPWRQACCAQVRSSSWARAAAFVLAGLLMVVSEGVASGTRCGFGAGSGSGVLEAPLGNAWIGGAARVAPREGCEPEEVPVCRGDCSSDAEVTIDEVVRSVLIALGAAPLSACANADANNDEQVTIDEIVAGVGRLLEGCPLGSGALYEVHACGEPFRVLLRQPQAIEEAERILAGSEPQKIVIGELRPGNGNFNGPWRWHLEPCSVGFAEAAIELCDGCPSYVEEHLAEWLEVVRRYCPWSAQLVRRIR